MPYWAVHPRRAEPRTARRRERRSGRLLVRPQDPGEGVGAQWRTTPLFGCYFFVRIVDRWRILERTIGVLNVVKFGAAPARCPDEEIARCCRGPILRRHPPVGPPAVTSSKRVLTPGAVVAIAGGPLRGFEGNLQRPVGARARDRAPEPPRRGPSGRDRRGLLGAALTRASAWPCGGRFSTAVETRH